jgi:ribose transport system permease protein
MQTQPTSPARWRRPWATRVRRDLSNRTVLAFVVLVLFWIATNVWVPNFATVGHTQYVLQTGAFLGLVAAGQTLVIIIGGIDLSVSAVLALGAVVCAQLISANHLDPLEAIAISLAISTLVGFGNGLGIRKLRLPPLVMTLATLTIIQGGLLLYTNGSPKSARVPILQFLANDKTLGIPTAFLLLMVVSVFCIWLLNYSRFGRSAYAMGINAQAARLSGVNLDRTTYLMYALSGLLSGIAGLVLFGFTDNSYLAMGNPYQLGSIAAVVLGGTSILGGRGHYLGTVAGALLLTILTGLLPVLNIPQAGQNITQGLVVLGLLLIYSRERGGD